MGWEGAAEEDQQQEEDLQQEEDPSWVRYRHRSHPRRSKSCRGTRGHYNRHGHSGSSSSGTNAIPTLIEPIPPFLLSPLTIPWRFALRLGRRLL